MSDYEVKIKDNSPQFKAELRSRISVILEALGLQVEGNAISEITELGAVDTGRLRGSITHETDDDAAYVGTNVEYAPYVELGTYRMAPRPFLKNAIINHTEEYKKIIEDGLK